MTQSTQERRYAETNDFVRSLCGLPPSKQFPVVKPFQLVVASWCDNDKIIALAKSRGWVEDGADSLLDVVEEDEGEKSREFTSVTKAKEWARRNRALDLWSTPSVYVYQWPDSRRLSWQRECVSHLRYLGGGCGWEDIT